MAAPQPVVNKRWIEAGPTDTAVRSGQAWLTGRERQIAMTVAQGLTNEEIAWVLGTTESNVKSAVSQLFRKLGLRDRFELAVHGLQYFRPGIDAFS